MVASAQTARRPNGVILYRGPSLLDGKPIVVVATGLRKVSERKANAKTGPMVQTYILADQGKAPAYAVQQGQDASICGDCPHRGYWDEGEQRWRDRSCYVNLCQGANSVWLALQRGVYPVYNSREHGQAFIGRKVRLGAYGDPAAVPLAVWKGVLRHAKSWTGYTHQWRTCNKAFRRLVMASCETPADAELARRKGYRTFRVKRAAESVLPGEIVCPASAEAGKRRTCATCNACSGAKASSTAASVVINVHGKNAVAKVFDRMRQRIELALV